jgi:hypothetical protein
MLNKKSLHSEAYVCVQELNLFQIIVQSFIHPFNQSKDRPVKLKTQHLVYLIVKKLTKNKESITLLYAK